MGSFDVFRKPLTVIRSEPGFTDQTTFLWVDGLESTFEITASVQPTPAEVMDTLPEGYRTKDSFTLFTDTELNTSIINNLGQSIDPDLVIINGERFIVTKVAEWQNNIISHYKVIVIKEGTDAS